MAGAMVLLPFSFVLGGCMGRGAGGCLEIAKQNRAPVPAGMGEGRAK